jgi:hypothetical protein
MKSLREAANIVTPLPEESAEENNKPSDGFFKSVLSNLKGMLADSEDATCLSSKRVVAFLAFICLVVAFFVDLFSAYKITQGIYDSMMFIVVAGLGFTGLERFAPKK